MSVGTHRWEAARGEWLVRVHGAARLAPALAQGQGWRRTALRDGG